MTRSKSIAAVAALAAVLTAAALVRLSAHGGPAPVTPTPHTTFAVNHNPCNTIAPIGRALKTDTAVNRWGDANWTAVLAADLSDYAAALGGPAAPAPFGVAAQDAENLAFATRIISAQDQTGAPTVGALEAADAYVPMVEADTATVEMACQHSAVGGAA